jgi:hypothetical protein
MTCRPLGAERAFMTVPSTLAAGFASLAAEADELGMELAGRLRPSKYMPLKVPLSVHEGLVCPRAARRGP